MNTFVYENVWLTISFWTVISIAAVFTIFVMSGRGVKDKSWRNALVVFTLGVVAFSVFTFNAVDKEDYLKAYQSEVTQHVKTVGQFDTVDGKLKITPGEASVYKVSVDKVAGDCSALYPTDSNGVIEFACGPNATPLKDAKAQFLKDSETVALKDSEKVTEAEAATKK